MDTRQVPRSAAIKKDGSRLFKDVDDDVYFKAFNQLQKMREANPTCRDDQLLMRLLCFHLDDEGGAKR